MELSWISYLTRSLTIIMNFRARNAIEINLQLERLANFSEIAGLIYF